MPVGCLDTANLDQVVSFLNELVCLDRQAVELLVETRVRCNQAMLSHPTVQVRENDDGHPTVGLLGIVNGMFGTQPDGSAKPGWGHVAAQFDDKTGKLMGFIRVDK